MILGLSPEDLLLVTAIGLIGAVIAGSAGIGLGLVASPVLLSIDPDFAPGPMLVGAMAISLRHVIVEFDEMDQGAIRRALVGLPFGLVAALSILRIMEPSTLSFGIGLFICAASAVLLFGVQVPRSPVTDALSGAACAFTSAAAALPGPPLVIGFHDLGPRCLRCTVSVFILVVGTVSLIGFFAIGRFGGREVELATALLPGVLTGLALSRFTRPYLDRSWFRPAVLVLAFIGGAALAIRQL